MTVRSRLSGRRKTPGRPGRSRVGTTSQDELIASVPGDLRVRLDGVVNRIPVDFGGGSGLPKALTSAALILGAGLQSYVEIGVYRGRSLLPVGAVFSYVGGGTATGVDPWSVGEAIQQDVDLFPPAAATVNDFVTTLDWDAMFAEVCARIIDEGVQDHCSLVRARASEASARFADASIGLLHVDGNHDESSVLEDLELYLPKVSPGGYVMLDDSSWGSVRAARSMMDAEHRMLFEDTDSDFVVYEIANRRPGKRLGRGAP